MPHTLQWSKPEINLPTPKPRPASKPKTQPKTQTKTDPKPKTTDKPGGSGVHGQFRKSNPPGPNVTKPYGEFDPSSRRVRRNQEDARRSRTAQNSEVKASQGSNRRNNAAIKAEVDRSSGGSKESQRAKERRQRLARERAARRNRMNMIARRNNDM